MTSTAAVKSFRVACDDYAFNRTPSYTAALRAKFAVERREDTCPGEHRVEGLVDGEWLPAHEAVARVALTAKVGTVVETLDGPLTKNTGTWSPETAARADEAGEAGSPEWYAALGVHEEATLTGDGRGAIVTAWCDCAAVEQVRYERWGQDGRRAHGLLCRSCRRLTQTG